MSMINSVSRRFFMGWALLTLLALGLGAQANVADYGSPRTGGNHSANTTGLPSAATANPAANAGVERTTLEAGYHLILGSDQAPGTGHWINLGTAVPTNLGVWSVNGRFATSKVSGQDFGTFGSLHGAFSKDLWEDLYFGLGLGAQVGTGLSAMDWGLGLDAGFVHRAGTLGILRDFTWGASIRGLGKPYSTALGSVPPAFTPALAAQATLYQNEALRLSASSDISAPTFQNLVWQTTLDAEILRTVAIQLGLDIDARALAAGTARGLPLNFGISARLGSPQEGQTDATGNPLPFYRNSEFWPSVSVRPLAKGAWDAGVGVVMPVGVTDRKAPVAIFEVPDTVYISPNFSGVQDSLEFDLKVTDQRYIESFSFVVLDQDGQVRRTIRNKEQRPEAETLGSLLDRFVRVKSGVPVPERLVWDGMDDQGTPLPDGTYSWFMEAVDDNGNTLQTPTKTVVIDTKAPELALEVPLDNPDRAFAPNGDRPRLNLAMRSSTEDRWKATVKNSQDEPVRNLTWETDLPSTLVWDGLADDGNAAPDGVYRIVLETTDRAGNTSTTEVDNILLISEPTPVSLRTEYQHFSPNNDGVQDDLVVAISSNPRVRVSRWVVEVKNTGGQTVRMQTGAGTLPTAVALRSRAPTEASPGTIDFLVGGEGNDRLPEGTYTVEVDTLYINGNRPLAKSPVLTLDTTPPRATQALAWNAFSPNNDGRKDSLAVDVQSSNEESWTATVRAGNTTVRRFQWSGTVPPRVEWDGRDEAGAIQADGPYTWELASTDLAGNRFETPAQGFTLDQRPVAVESSVLHQAFSPAGNSPRKQQEINLSATPASATGGGSALASWTVRVRPSGATEAAATVWTQRGTGALPARLTWDGRTDTGTMAADGRYEAEVEVEWAKGDLVRHVSAGFTVDSTAPSISLAHSLGSEAPRFSPDGDGQRDVLGINQTGSREELWTGEVRRGNEVVRRWTWNGSPASFEWDGASNEGTRAADGTNYEYVVSATDAAGNTAQARIADIGISTRPTEVRVDLGLRAFSPNADGRKDSMIFRPQLGAGATIDSWELQILSVGRSGPGTAVHTIRSTTRGVLPPAIEWNGLAGSRPAPEGEYQGRLIITNPFGTRSQADSLRFVLDTTAPVAEAWPTSISVFSPDGDGRNDRISISLKGSEPATWTARMVGGSTTTALRSWTWTGNLPETVEWDGQDEAKKLLADGTYNFEITGEDEAGNVSAPRRTEVALDTRQATLRLALNLRAFSPNADNVRDRLVLSPGTDLADGIASWTLDIRNTSGAVVRSFGQTGRLPPTVEWDGRNASNAVVPDGAYTAALRVAYTKGNQPSIQSDVITVDNTAPRVSLEPQVILFSPEGDGFKDQAVVRQTSSTEERWTGEILDASNRVIRTFTWTGQTRDLAWDGKTDQGVDAPDGTYAYQVRAEDAAGNRTSQRVTGIRIDRTPTPVRLVAASRGFAPVPGSAAPLMGFQPSIEVREGVESWTLSIRNEADQVVRSFEGRGLPGERLNWDGNNASNTRAPDGRYTGHLEMVYAKGNRPVASSAPFLLDSQGPEGRLVPTPNPFSPDDDGLDDELTLNIQVSDPSEIRDWKLTIRDDKGEVFTEFAGRGQPAPRIQWNGKSRTGELVQAALDYPVELSMTDSLGNVASVKAVISVDVLVIRDGDLLRIRLPGITFPANAADLTRVDTDKLLVNNKTLDRMAEILRRYSTYQVTIEGHANYTTFGAANQRTEQERELLPLSTARAEAVRQALIARGIPASRLSSLGVGGARPVVPFDDSKNNWKNRRVEFILRK